MKLKLYVATLEVTSILLLGMSCNNVVPSQEQKIFTGLRNIKVSEAPYPFMEIDIDKIERKIHTLNEPDLCKVNFIKLTTEKRSFVAEITEVLIHKDRIYILDRQQELFLYSICKAG